MASPEPKKFLFNNRDFSDGPVEDKKAAKPAAPPPPVTYTEEQMDVVRAQAKDEGRREAAQAHQQSTEAQLAQVTQEILRQIQTIANAQATKNARDEHEAMTLAMAMLEHLYPIMNEKMNVDQFLFDVQQLLQQARGQHNVAVQVHPEMLHDLAAHIGSMEGVSLASSADIRPGDVKVSWDHGTASVTRDAVLQQMRDLLRGAFEGEGQARNIPGVMGHGDGLADHDDAVRDDGGDVAGHEGKT